MPDPMVNSQITDAVTQTNVKDPGYDSLRKELYNDIRREVYDNYPQIENYFPATTQGVLKAGHAVFQSMYQYYIPRDVDQIQGMVEYWKSLAAAGNLYIVNMYSYDPALASNMATQNQYAQKTDARILKAMHRPYTPARFLEICEKMKAARPELAITTDIIVGFPGETEADFEAIEQAVMESAINRGEHFRIEIAQTCF